MKRALLALLFTLLIAAPASADVIDVTTTADGNGVCPGTQCTLREALDVANESSEGDTINLRAGTYTLDPRFGELGVPGDVSILGLGAHLTRIAGSGSSRVFNVSAGAQSQLARLTVAGGRAITGNDTVGGNLLMQHGAELLLDHVRVTDGIAFFGGGIATGGGGSLEIRHSLIDANQASGGNGGGILQRSTDNPQTLTVSDSTIAFNRAQSGAGIMSNHSANETTLTRVTIADNVSTSTSGGGIFISAAASFAVQGSIIARNTGNIGAAAPLPAESNCGPLKPTDAGGNVESKTDCNFTLASDIQNTTAGLATALTDDGGMTPVLPIPYTSPARERAGPCTGTDQRDVTRAQPAGGLCDAGAYEALPPPPPAQVTPTPTPSAPVAQVTPTPTPTAAPQPVVNKTIVVAPVRGTIRVKLPGSKTFEDLDVTKGIPVGSTVDTRKGRVRLTSIPKAGAPPETAEFYDGLFKVTQSRGITTLTLTEQLAPCPKGRARAAAKKPKTRKLWGSGKGKFRTAGKYSAATVRGTQWLVQDSCAGTLTRVTQGSVSVRDNVRKRTVIVRSGKRYTARPKP